MTDDTLPSREPGFYWIKRGENPPEIAHWNKDEWWLCGREQSWPLEYIVVIGSRLVLRPDLRIVQA